MRVIVTNSLCALLLTAVPLSPVSAQTALGFDPTSLQASCAAAPDTCLDLLMAQLVAAQTAGLSSADFDTVLATLAAIAVETARASSAATANMAQAIRQIALAATNGAQAESLLQVAQLVEDGQVGAIDNTAFAASPA